MVSNIATAAVGKITKNAVKKSNPKKVDTIANTVIANTIVTKSPSVAKASIARKKAKKVIIFVPADETIPMRRVKSTKVVSYALLAELSSYDKIYDLCWIPLSKKKNGKINMYADDEFLLKDNLPINNRATKAALTREECSFTKLVKGDAIVVYDYSFESLDNIGTLEDIPLE